MYDRVGAVWLERQRLALAWTLYEVAELHAVLTVLGEPCCELGLIELPDEHLTSDLANDAELTRSSHKAFIIHNFELAGDFLELERRDYGREGLALRANQLAAMRFHLLNQLAIDLVDFRLDRRDQCAVICSSRCLCCFEIGVAFVELNLQSETTLGKLVDAIEHLGIDVGHVNHLLVFNEL